MAARSCISNGSKVEELLDEVEDEVKWGNMYTVFVIPSDFCFRSFLNEM